MAISISTIAQAFLHDKDNLEDLVYVTNWNIFYYFNNKYYERMDVLPLKKLLNRYIKQAPAFAEVKLSDRLLLEVIAYLKVICKKNITIVDSLYLAFEDKLLNLETFEYEDFSRDKLCIHYLPYKTNDFDRETPIFNKFLETSLVKSEDDYTPDAELIFLMQEVFGFYLIINNLKAESVFFFTGEGSNGKSTIGMLLVQILGEEFAMAESIEALTTDKFSVANLVGKKINICNEEESKYIKQQKFKALVTGDYVTGERKFEGKFLFRPSVKYLFSTNNMPTFDGMDGGLKRRMKIVPFRRKFEDHEQDKFMLDKLITEIPGIIGWAIEGAKRLAKNHYIFSSKATLDAELRRFESEMSSAIAFWHEHDYVATNRFSDQYVASSEMYNDYKAWCSDTGRRPLNMANFYRDLKIVFQVAKGRKYIGLDQCRVYYCFRQAPQMEVNEEVEVSSLDTIIEDMAKKTETFDEAITKIL